MNRRLSESRADVCRARPRIFSVSIFSTVSISIFSTVSIFSVHGTFGTPNTDGRRRRRRRRGGDVFVLGGEGARGVEYYTP